MGIRRFAPVVVAALLAALFAWGTPTCASACSCAPRTVAEHVADADYVARVTVTNVQPPASDLSAQGLRVYTFRVSHVWKGEATPTGQVSSVAQGPSCGLEFIDIGDELVLFGFTDRDVLTATLCGGTAKAEPGLVAEVTSVLGPGQAVVAEPKPEAERPSDSPGGWVIWLGVAGGVLLVAALVALLLSRAARKRAS